jgi:hypothetical protein
MGGETKGTDDRAHDAKVVRPSPSTEVGEAVGHLSDYFKHLTTVSAGASAFLAAFAGDLLSVGDAAPWAIGAVIFLGLCILASTAMMWAYGVARRQTTSSSLAGTASAWAFEAGSRQVGFAKRAVKVASWAAPLLFVLGFGCLAGYALTLLT